LTFVAVHAFSPGMTGSTTTCGCAIRPVGPEVPFGAFVVVAGNNFFIFASAADLSDVSVVAFSNHFLQSAATRDGTFSGIFPLGPLGTVSSKAVGYFDITADALSNLADAFSIT